MRKRDNDPIAVAMRLERYGKIAIGVASALIGGALGFGLFWVVN
jgi:hypothetical protein